MVSVAESAAAAADKKLRAHIDRPQTEAALAAGRQALGAPAPETHDAKNFYLSRAWRALRYRALRENAEKHDGRLTCETCGSTAGPWHVDHIVPRSRDRSRELDLTNVGIKCEACNLGKGNTDSLVWDGGKIVEVSESGTAA